ncbi:MAG: copper chaperone CopZ [Pirellulaceae bacterium]|jgi:copper chaperone CopZ
MFTRIIRVFLAVAIIAIAMQTAVATAAQPAFTEVVVTNMHCDACAKKIAGKLYLLKGVKEVRAELKSNTAYVVSQQNKNISPKAIWEAVEKAGFKVVKLNGPAGLFKTKPEI